MAKTFKPIHSRPNKGQNDALSSIQREADIFKTPKNSGNPVKINKVHYIAILL